MATKATRSVTRCFIALPHTRDHMPVRVAIKRALRGARLSEAQIDNFPLTASISDILRSAISRCDCLVADLSDRSSDVYYQIGLAQAMGKALFLICREDGSAHLPDDILSLPFLRYRDTEEGLDELVATLSTALKRFKETPRSAQFLSGQGNKAPFIVDWDRIDERDFDNLVVELLFQMGFKRVQWLSYSPVFDIAAELPKKDPDGFSYNEKWFVSLGRNSPIERSLEIVTEQPDYLFDMLDADHSYRGRSQDQESSSVSILFILLKNLRIDESEHLKYKIERPDYRRPSRSGYVRTRLWDRMYLSSLVQQFPQIGYKYFTEEGRSLAKFRKTPEELNNENIQVAESLMIANTNLEIAYANLESEKNRRIRAERDAVWKDVSFSAAHKMGNPIFAIETDLGPLERRVKEERKDDALEVISNMYSAVEKAKAIVEQFKSLAKAQDVKLSSVALCPIIADSMCHTGIHAIDLDFDCDPSIYVQGDTERLAECFDELFINSLHWFDKQEKKISIKVISPATSIPEGLDSNLSYAHVIFADNGVGIPSEMKNEIFNPFCTTRDQGTGLGLALVRRIIEGHGGTITESGIFQEGAVFDIYLRLPEKVKTRRIPHVSSTKVTKN